MCSMTTPAIYCRRSPPRDLQEKLRGTPLSKPRPATAILSRVLSDNGYCFTGRLQGFEVEFERKLKELGVDPIHSGPYHPQTLGKLERFHKTRKQWLADQDPAANLDQLQQLLDKFREHYNQQRPNQGIGDVTPAKRFFAEERAAPPEPTTPPPADNNATVAASDPPSYPAHSIIRKADSRGVITYERMRIIIGRRWGGARVVLQPVGRLIHIYGETLIRSVAPDPERSLPDQGQGVSKEVMQILVSVR